MSPLPPLDPTVEPTSPLTSLNEEGTAPRNAASIAFRTRNRLKRWAPLAAVIGVFFLATASLSGLYLFQNRSLDDRSQADAPVISQLLLGEEQQLNGNRRFTVTLDNTLQLAKTQYASVTTELEIKTNRTTSATEGNAVLGETDEAPSDETSGTQVAQLNFFEGSSKTKASPSPTSERTRCWNQVLRVNRVYYWPNSCRGFVNSDTVCAQTLTKLRDREVENYQQWVKNGRKVPTACLTTRPTPTPSTPPSAAPTPTPSPGVVLTQDDKVIVFSNATQYFDSYYAEIVPTDEGYRIIFNAQLASNADAQKVLQGNLELFRAEVLPPSDTTTGQLTTTSIKGYSPRFPGIMLELSQMLPSPSPSPSGPVISQTPRPSPSSFSTPRPSTSPKPTSSVVPQTPRPSPIISSPQPSSSQFPRPSSSVVASPTSRPQPSSSPF